MQRKVVPRHFRGGAVIIEDKPIEQELSQVEVGPPPLPWLTLETLLYGIILLVALGLRLWQLGAYPLSNAEAGQSLLAFQFYRGLGLPETTEQYSPLLLSLNTLTFLLFGASDASARLASLLLGSVLVLLPLTLRRQLGPLVCLLTTALLAISPTALFLSRTLNSEIAVATGALMLVAGFFNWAEDGQFRWLLLLAGGLALMLTAGPLAYSILLIFGLIVFFKFSAFEALWRQGLKQPTEPQVVSPTPPDGTQATVMNPSVPDPAPAALEDQPLPEASHRTQLPAKPQFTPPSSQLIFRYAGLFFLVVLILLATTATLNLKGFSLVTGFLVDWLGRFNFQGRPDAGFNAVFLLTIYEPLLVFAGLAGLAYAILQQPHLLKLTLVGWFVGLLAIDVVMAGRPNSSVILPLVPLAFLTSLVLVELWNDLRQWGNWSNEGLLLVAGLVIAVFAYIYLTDWLVRICSPDDVICQWRWLLVAVALVLYLIILIFFWFVSDAGVAVRGVALTGVVLGLAAVLSIGWRLNYGPLMDLGYQPLAGIPASTELVTLTETLANQSAERVGDQTLLDVALVGPTGPALAWQLRNYRYLTHATSTTDLPPTTAIITPATAELGLGEAYLGQSFTLDAAWSPVGLSPKELINWLIYRRVLTREDRTTDDAEDKSDHVVLWLRMAKN